MGKRFRFKMNLKKYIMNNRGLRDSGMGQGNNLKQNPQLLNYDLLFRHLPTPPNYFNFLTKTWLTKTDFM